MAERKSRKNNVVEEEFLELEYLGRKGLRCSCHEVSVTTDADGAEDVTLDVAGEIRAKTLPVRIGDLPESSALRGKRRPHLSENGKECILELQNSIPFGEEPEVLRKIRMEGRTLSCTLDMKMRTSCRVKNISAGGLELGGPLRKILFPGSDIKEVDFEALEEGAIFFDSEEIPLLVIFETKKSALAFAPGDDLWRWDLAKKIGGKGRFYMQKKENKVLFFWELFSLETVEEESLPDGRNIRLTYLLSWHLKRSEKGRKYKYKDFCDMTEISLQESFLRENEKGEKSPCGCFASQGTENILKKYVRSLLENAEEGDRYAILGILPGVCYNASHLERGKAKSLRHQDLAALVDFHSWANRQLGRKGAALDLVTVEGSPLKNWMEFV